MSCEVTEVKIPVRVLRVAWQAGRAERVHYEDGYRPGPIRIRGSEVAGMRAAAKVIVEYLRKNRSPKNKP